MSISALLRAWFLLSGSLALVPAFVVQAQEQPATPPSQVAAAPASTPTAPEWVPFVAEAKQTNYTNAYQGVYKVEMSGPYVRNKHGSWYRRYTLAPGTFPVPMRSDSATMYDSTDRTTYLIDYDHRAIRRLDSAPAQSALPTSREEFEKSHSEDKLMGKQVIAGVECEVYGIHDPRHKGKFTDQIWFAPSLNFQSLKSRSRLPNGQEVTIEVSNIQVGQEPDPQYFKLPDGFKPIN